MQEVVEFIPAAGVGSRMNGFPIMKEMLPMQGHYMRHILNGWRTFRIY